MKKLGLERGHKQCAILLLGGWVKMLVYAGVTTVILTFIKRGTYFTY